MIIRGAVMSITFAFFLAQGANPSPRELLRAARPALFTDILDFRARVLAILGRSGRLPAPEASR
jgi:hypothetical protein